MNAQQEAPAAGQRPPRRAFRTLLLTSVPVVLAAIGGIVAANVVPVDEMERSSHAAAGDPAVREVAAVENRPVSASANVLGAVVAPAVAMDLSDGVPKIEVSFPPEPEPEPVLPAPVRATNSGGGSTASTPAKSSSQSAKKTPAKKAAAQSYDSFCGSASAKHSAGGSVKGLLSAANRERARLGISPLSWSGSLASAATGWSKAMASKDSAGNGKQLAHNPNRPGAENVAVSGSSGGMSTGSAVNNAHAGWVASAGHCRNLMNPAYSTMGAGTASTSNGQAVYTTANYR